MKCQMNLNSDNIHEYYVQEIYPPRFVLQFDTMHEFKMWLRLGTIDEVDQCRRVFERYELYEHCQACVEVIQEKDHFWKHLK